MHHTCAARQYSIRAHFQSGIGVAKQADTKFDNHRNDRWESLSEFHRRVIVFENRSIFLHFGIAHTSSVIDSYESSLLVLLPYLHMYSASLKFSAITFVSVSMTPVKIKNGFLANIHPCLAYSMLILTKKHIRRIRI